MTRILSKGSRDYIYHILVAAHAQVQNHSTFYSRRLGFLSRGMESIERPYIGRFPLITTGYQ